MSSLLKSLSKKRLAVYSHFARTMESKEYQEVRLLKDEQQDNSGSSDTSSETIIFKNSTLSRKQFLVHLSIAYIINVLLVILVLVLLLSPGNYHDPSVGTLYSPAQDVIEYEIISFPESTQNKSKYQADKTTGIPTDETDKLWDELYLFGMQTWVDEPTARKLPNRTLAVPDDSNKYVIQLDVFHQLHCLDVLRTLLWPERYKHRPHTDYYLANGERNYTSSAAKHYDHCLEYLRKSVMCHSDISVVYYGYTEGGHGPSPQELEPHTCRNFEKVQDWARERVVYDLNWPKEWPHGKPPESAYSVLDQQS